MIFGEMVQTLLSALQPITHEPLGFFQSCCCHVNIPFRVEFGF
jgi:hypothetical protein